MRHLAVVLFLVATGSIAAASPRHHGKKSHRVETVDDAADRDRDAEDAAASRRDGARVAHEAWHRAKPGRVRGTAAEDIFADDGDGGNDAASPRRHHVDLDAPADDGDRDTGRVALEKTTRHRADLERSDDDARPRRRHRTVVETLPSDDEVLPNRKKHHAVVETLPSDADADAAASAPHRKSRRHARATAGGRR